MALGRGLRLGFDLRYSAETSPKCQGGKMNREGGWSHAHSPGEPGHGACWHPLTFLVLPFSLELGVWAGAISTAGPNSCHHIPFGAKLCCSWSVAKTPSSIYELWFFFTLNKCLRRSIFLQLMISAVSNSKWGLHPSPQNALLHHSLLVRAQQKSGPSTFKWSGYIVWQLVPLHLPLCCGRGVLWKQLDGEKQFKCWTPNQCLHFQFSTDGSPLSACTYINKKPFCQTGFAFPGALW